ncbi:MAG: glutathione S-transferase family protein [Solirubrobacteraceae bacterium]
MGLTLYYMGISHPSNAARLMLDYKGLAYRRVDVRPGFQPFSTRLHGFSKITVPALELDAQRIQGSCAIAQALEQRKPDPSLYPSDPQLRAAVQEAESWDERALQPVPRHLFRWALISKPAVLESFVSDFQRLRPAKLVAKLQARPLARFIGATGVNDERVRADMRALPGMLEHVRELLDTGVLGSEQPNAADFQIATTLRAMDALEDLQGLLEDRLCSYARFIWPETELHLPSVLPPDWLPQHQR